MSPLVQRTLPAFVSAAALLALSSCAGVGARDPALEGWRASSEEGALRLRVSPPEAQVSIDGVPYGDAAGISGRAIWLRPGRLHRVEVWAAGYKRQLLEVEVAARVIQTLQIRLLPAEPLGAIGAHRAPVERHGALVEKEPA